MLPLLLSISIGIASIFLPVLHPNLLTVIFSNFLTPEDLVFFTIPFFIFYKYFDSLRLMLFRYVDPNSEFSYFPLCRLLRKHEGYAPLVLFGSLLCIIFSILLAPTYVLILRFAWPFFRNFLPLILLTFLSIIFLREGNRVGALLIFLLSGVAGILVLKIFPPLLTPLFTGFFSLPYLLMDLEVRERESSFSLNLFRLKFKTMLKTSLLATIASIPFSLIPTITSTQLSIILKRKKDEEKVILNSGIDAATPIFSLISLIAIGKSRSGCVELIREFLYGFDQIFLLSLGCAILSFLLSLLIYRIFLRIHLRHYKKLLKCFAIILAIMILLLYGILSVPIMLLGLTIAKLSERLKVRKVNCMGSLMLPTLLYYLFSIRI